MKFLIDMPITPAAVARLKAHGHDAVHASNIRLAKAKDSETLSFGRREGRIVVTADLDYPRLLAIQRADSPGVLLFRGGSYSDVQILHLLERVLLQSKPADLEHSVTVVDLTRVRRHRLPIDG